MRKSTLYIISAILMFILSGIILTNSFNIAQQKVEEQQINARTHELDFIHWIYIPDEIFTLFSQEHPDIKVKYTRYLKSSYSDMQQMLLLSGEKVDLMGVLNEDYIRIANNGWLADLSGSAALNNYKTDVRESVRNMLGGKEYAVALRSSYYAVWYNKIFFDQYNLKVPQSYYELLNVCRMLRSNNVNPIVIGARDESSAALLLLTRLFDIMNEPSWENKYTLGIKDFKADSSELLKQTNMLIGNAYIDPESINLTSQQAFEYFKTGKAAMVITSDQSLSMTGNDMEKVCDPGVFLIPYSSDGDNKTPVVMAQDLVGINSGSDAADEAKLFLQFLSRPDIATIFYKSISAYPTIQNVDTSYLNYNDLWEFVRSNENVNIDFFSISEEKQSLISGACQLFFIGEIGPEQLQETIESCMIVKGH